MTEPAPRSAFEQVESITDVSDEIERLCEAGEELASAQRHAEALPLFEAAWNALPNPKGNLELLTNGASRS